MDNILAQYPTSGTAWQTVWTADRDVLINYVQVANRVGSASTLRLGVVAKGVTWDDATHDMTGPLDIETGKITPIGMGTLVNKGDVLKCKPGGNMTLTVFGS